MRIFIKTIIFGLLVALLAAGAYVLIKQYKNIESLIGGSSSSANTNQVIEVDLNADHLLHYE